MPHVVVVLVLVVVMVVVVIEVVVADVTGAPSSAALFIFKEKGGWTQLTHEDVIFHTSLITRFFKSSWAKNMNI